MKILLVAEVLHPDTVGGAGRVAARLAEGLARREHDVRVVTRATEAAPDSEAARDGYRIFRFPARTLGPIAAWRSTSAGIREAAERALRGFRPDVLHGHQPLATAFALRRVAAPLVYTFYAPWPAEYRSKRRGRAAGRPAGGWSRAVDLADRAVAAGMGGIEAVVLRAAGRVACLSSFSAAQVAERYPRVAAARPPRIVPGGVDLDRFRPAARSERIEARWRWSLPGEAFVALTVRNLVPRMGLERLIEAAVAARRDVPDLVVAIAGEGPLRADLERLAERRGVAASVRFLGRVEETDLPALYRAADLFALPTRALEGFGLVILEAYATGLPVLGTRVGAIPEIVAQDSDEWLVLPTVPAIADGLVRAARRRASDARPDAAARRRRIAEGYSWEKMVEAYERLYAEAVG